MSGDDSIVYIVDDDSSMREALTRLLGTVGLRAEAFKTPQEFLHAKRSDAPSCLVLDVRLPGLSGLDLQRELANTDPPIQIVFITAHGDIPMTVQALKAGAVDFLTKPFRDQQLLDAVRQAINRDRAVRTNRRRAARCCARRIHARRTPPGRALVRRWRRGVLHLLAIKKRERNGSHLGVPTIPPWRIWLAMSVHPRKRCRGVPDKNRPGPTLPDEKSALTPCVRRCRIGSGPSCHPPKPTKPGLGSSPGDFRVGSSRSSRWKIRSLEPAA